MAPFLRLILPMAILGCIITGPDCQGQANLLMSHQAQQDSARLNQLRIDSIYRNMELPNVGMERKKWSWNRRLFQNLVTRYNYYYNASNKLQKALEKVQRAYLEDYSTLLPLYPYRMYNMLMVKSDLDSVIHRASIGVEIHDMRGKWIPDLYLLIGKAYYFEGNYPNAAQAFQFINIRYAPKNKNDYTPVIGSAGYQSKTQISVSTKENAQATLYRLKHHASRNTAFLWRARTMIRAGEEDQALSLINILKSDPEFPARLRGQLAETEAFYFFHNRQYDKAIAPLELAIHLSSDHIQKSRWEFIIGQLDQAGQDVQGALSHYHQSILLTRDPMMDFYAHLNIARVNISSGKGSVAQNTKTLVNMAHRNKYRNFRDIIYYSLARLALRSGDDSSAIAWLHSSLQFSSGDMSQTNRAFDLLAQLYYNQAAFRPASLYYDSTSQTMNLAPSYPDSALVALRTAGLKEVIPRLDIIRRQDSLQRIADMPDSIRNAYLLNLLAIRQATLKKKQRELRRHKLHGEQPNGGSSSPFANPQTNSQTPQVAASAWYFYNQSSLASGLNLFQQQWGNRPLVDNWRRSSAIQGIFNSGSTATANDSLEHLETAALKKSQDALSMAALIQGLPTTPEKMTQSNDSLIAAYDQLGSIFYDGLSNLPAAIADFEELRHRFPDNPDQQQVAYMLYLLYGKDNQAGQALAMRHLILTRYPGSEYALLILHGHVTQEQDILKSLVTRFYDSTYLDYLSGDYATVIARCRQAGKLYGRSFLPGRIDLLHAMAIIKTSGDQEGITAIGEVIRQHPAGAIHDQAVAILGALEHKQQIIDYLTQLQITPDTSQQNRGMASASQPPAPIPLHPAPLALTLKGSQQATGLSQGSPGYTGVSTTGGNLRLGSAARKIRDSLEQAEKTGSSEGQISASSPVVKALGGRQPALAATAVLPGHSPLSSAGAPISLSAAADKKADSLAMAETKTLPVAGTHTDSGQVLNPQNQAPVPSAAPQVSAPYQPGLKEPYFVVMDFQFINSALLDKCLTQFARYNSARIKRDSTAVEVSSFVLTRNKVMLIFRLFGTQAAALSYYNEISTNAHPLIIPDVNPAFYRFFYISRSNFILLNQTKDYTGYLDYFNRHYLH